MQTDWLLVRRLAAELDERLRGGRIAAVGLLPDGRFALDVRAGRGRPQRLAVDAFAATPLAWLGSEALAARDLRAAPGWSRAFADALEGRRIERIRGRTGDRLIAIEARARSRFGVESDLRLVLELAPKFGNVLLLKETTVIAAAREFEPAAGARGRTIVPGGAYEPPPLPAPRPEPEAAGVAFVAYANGGPPAAVVRALRRERPLVPALVAEALVAELLASMWSSGAALRAALVARADAVLPRLESARGPVVTYREGGHLAQAHLLTLPRFEAEARYVVSSEPELAPLFTELGERGVAPVARESFERRRASFAQRLERRRVSIAAQIDAARRDAADDGEGDRLRRAGEALYTHQAAVVPGATTFAVPATEAAGFTIALDPALDARANATGLFARYRRVANRRTHAERRLGELRDELERLEELAWELGRAEPEMLAELAAAIDEAVPSGAARTARVRKPSKRVASGGARGPKPHRFELGDGARLFVGRSPHGNAEVTFRLGRPDDWWFHVRGVPGAHVILQIDAAREPTERELESAAEAAAAFSSVAEAERVEVDRTRRKYVRKRETGPGHVWYVNAQTLAVRPAVPAPAPAPA